MAPAEAGTCDFRLLLYLRIAYNDKNDNALTDPEYGHANQNRAVDWIVKKGLASTSEDGSTDG